MLLISYLNTGTNCKTLVPIRNGALFLRVSRLVENYFRVSFVSCQKGPTCNGPRQDLARRCTVVARRPPRVDSRSSCPKHGVAVDLQRPLRTFGTSRALLSDTSWRRRAPVRPRGACEAAGWPTAHLSGGGPPRSHVPGVRLDREKVRTSSVFGTAEACVRAYVRPFIGGPVAQLHGHREDPLGQD